MAGIGEIVYTLKLPSEANASFNGKFLTIKTSKAEIKKEFANYRVEIQAKDNKIVLVGKPNTRKTMSVVKTAIANIKNMVEGALYGYKVHMKIVYSHFPITTQVDKDIFLVKNYLGEKFPRKATIREGVKIENKGADITVTGYNKDNVTQTASSVEQMVRIKDKDIRRYQDGVYITGIENIHEKPEGKIVEVLRGRE